MEKLEFQGSNIVEVPKLPGIYAWYYRPLGKPEIDTLAKLLTMPFNIKTEIGMRYRVIWQADSNFNVLYGDEREPIDKVFYKFFARSGDLTKLLIQMVPQFAKPLYIGISDNLYSRVKHHYDRLTELWNSNNSVNEYLKGHPDADVEEILNQLDLKHEFSISARVNGIAPRDLLVVCVSLIEPREKLEDLERILQILADPICGRS